MGRGLRPSIARSYPILGPQYTRDLGTQTQDPVKPGTRGTSGTRVYRGSGWTRELDTPGIRATQDASAPGTGVHPMPRVAAMPGSRASPGPDYARVPAMPGSRLCSGPGYARVPAMPGSRLCPGHGYARVPAVPGSRLGPGRGPRHSSRPGPSVFDRPRGEPERASQYGRGFDTETS